MAVILLVCYYASCPTEISRRAHHSHAWQRFSIWSSRSSPAYLQPAIDAAVSAVLLAAVGAADAFDRKRCAAPGRYEPRNGTDLLARAFDGPSFFGEGRWLNNKYVLQPPCELKEGDAFACSVVAKIPRNGSRARILMVGDSISIRQFQDLKRRVQRCDADVAFLRADSCASGTSQKGSRRRILCAKRTRSS